MKKYILMLIINVVLAANGYGQQKTRVLQVGDTIPNVTIQLKNYPKKSAKLSDFRNKLLILDFWNVWCGSCIQAIPEMEKLQHEFKDKIQIILVTSDGLDRVQTYAEKIKNIKNCTLPMFIGDTVLRRLLPIRSVPTHVWIDKNGVIKAITDGYNTTSKSITLWLSGDEPRLPVKTEWQDFNPDNSFLTLSDKRLLTNVSSYSIFLKHIDNYGGASFRPLRDSLTDRLVGIHGANLSLFILYKEVFGKDNLKPDFLFKNRFILSKPLAARFFMPNDPLLYTKWLQLNTFCYERRVPLENAGQIFTVMQQDLDDYFSLRSSIQKRKILCYVLKRISLINTINIPGSPQFIIPNSEDRNASTLSISPNWKSFVGTIKSVNQAKNTPILDETGFAGDQPINIILTKPDDIDTLQNDIKKYGLKLEKEYKMVDMVVIKNK